jgi:hypothetical protein
MTNINQSKKTMKNSIISRNTRKFNDMGDDFRELLLPKKKEK